MIHNRLNVANHGGKSTPGPYFISTTKKGDAHVSVTTDEKAYLSKPNCQNDNFRRSSSAKAPILQNSPYGSVLAIKIVTMMNWTQKLVCLLALTGFIPTTALGLELTVKQGDSNSLGDDYKPYYADDELRFNKQDCLDDITFEFEIDFSDDDTQGKKLYWFSSRGTDCRNAEDVSNCYAVELDYNENGSIFTYNPTARFMANSPNTNIPVMDESICSSGTDSGEGWAALLTSKSERTATDGAIWSEPISINFDFIPPNTPTNITAVPGEEKVEVEWDWEDEDGADASDAGTTTGSGSSDDNDGFYVVYWGGSGSGDGDTDTDTDSDTDTDIDTDSVADAGADGGVDAGAPVGSGSTANPVYGLLLLGANGDQDNCPAGGFEPNDEFDPASDYSEQKATGSSLSHTVKGLTNSTTYKLGVVAFDEYKNFSVISEVACATPGETTDFFEHYREAGGKAGGKFCFVATAVFGDYDHPVVKLLRLFRDDFLEPMPGGSSLVQAYYAVGPSLAEGVDKSPVLSFLVKQGLLTFSSLAWMLSVLGPKGLGLGTGIFLVLMLSLAIPRQRRTR